MNYFLRVFVTICAFFILNSFSWALSNKFENNAPPENQPIFVAGFGDLIDQIQKDASEVIDSTTRKVLGKPETPPPRKEYENTYPRTTTYPAPKPYQHYGLSKEQNREIQQLLLNAGYNPGPADGMPGKKTKMAIRQYQAANGLTINDEPSESLLTHLRSKHQNTIRKFSLSETRISKADLPSKKQNDTSQILKYGKSKKGEIVFGQIKTPGYISGVSSIITNDNSTQLFGVYLSLFNSESNGNLHNECKTYILDNFGNDVRNLKLRSKWKEYNQFVKERVKLENVRKTALKGNCFFSHLSFFGDEQFKSRKVVGIVMRKGIGNQYQVHGKEIREPISFALENPSYPGSSPLNCSHFYLNKVPSASEFNKSFQMAGSRVTLHNVRYGQLKGSCLFDRYEFSQADKTTQVVNKTNKANNNKSDILQHFGTVTGRFKSIDDNGIYYNIDTNRVKGNHRLIRKCRHFINSNSKLTNDIPRTITNSDGYEVRPLVIMHGVVWKKRTRTCYFQSISLMEDSKVESGKKYMTLNNIYIKRSTTSSITINHKKHPELSDNKCIYSTLNLRRTKNNNSPKVNPGSIVNIINVSKHIHGQGCTYERIEIVKNAAVNNKNLTKIPDFHSGQSKNQENGANVVVGKLEQNINMIADSKKQGYKSLRFSMSNQVKPASKPYSCQYYQADKSVAPVYVNSTLNKYKKLARNNTKLYLKNVRPSNTTGTCLFSSASQVNVHTYAYTVTQAQVNVTSAEQISKRNSLYDYCQSKVKLNRQFRCECMADKSLQLYKLFPEKINQEQPDTTFMLVSKNMMINNVCVNTVQIAKQEYQMCTEEFQMRKKLTNAAADYCQCYAKNIEKLAAKESMANMNGKRRVKTQARVQCRTLLPKNI